MTATEGFRPPPYPYDRLDDLRVAAEAHEGGCVDLSVGTPTDAPPAFATRELSSSGAAQSYPPSVGTPALREAACSWIERRFGVVIEPTQVAACVGTKELVAGLPHLLRLRTPSKDTVLYPAVSYPSYAMGATLAGCRAVPVPVDERWRLDLDRVDPDAAARALCLWVNTPGNPAGGLDDLGVAAAWGRRRGVPVFSDECYTEFTWEGRPRTVLEHGSDGVVAVHSLSKRSNLAGARVGFYAGDGDLVSYLGEVRKHGGLMPPGPSQAAAVVALGDQYHVDEQRERYRRRLARGREILEVMGVDVVAPCGGFYLWAPAPDGDSWGFARRLATEVGVLSSPGEFYGGPGASHLRLAMVQPVSALDLVSRRLGGERT